LMHVASAFDIPQVVIIGSTDYIATGPINPRSSIVRVPTSCSPCLKPDCPEDHRCMNRVTVDMVFNTAETLLEESYKK
jgi:heptosyltransferase-2